MIRSPARRALLRRLRRRARLFDVSDLPTPVLVLAPHPDDETLGCGGLIATLRAQERAVIVAFLTDGSASHPSADLAELARRRRIEAISAAGVLGVDADHLRFLDHPDGWLLSESDAVTSDVADLIVECDPGLLVLPHPDEPPADHRAAYDATEGALDRLGRQLPALLYPIWMWDQLPWTNPFSPPKVRHSRRAIVRVARRDRLGTRVIDRLTDALDVTGVLETKRHALDCYASQMTGSDEAFTLAGVAGGQWLELLLQDHEYFGRARLGPADGTT